MVQYWPNAITKDGEKLFTYSPHNTEGGCIAQFMLWEGSFHYEIKEAWIDCCHILNGKERWTRRMFRKEWVGDKYYKTINNPS